MKTWIAIILACGIILTAACEKSATAITDVYVEFDTIISEQVDTLMVFDTIIVVDSLICEPRRGKSDNYRCRPMP